MSRFDSQIALAQRLLALNGKTVTVRRYTQPSPADPDKPWRVGDPTTSDQTCPAVILDYPPDFVESWSLQRGDKILLIAGGDLADTPKIQDQVIIDEEYWSIQHLSTLAPNGQLILHTLQVRKWPRRLN